VGVSDGAWVEFGLAATVGDIRVIVESDRIGVAIGVLVSGSGVVITGEQALRIKIDIRMEKIEKDLLDIIIGPIKIFQDCTSYHSKN